jgi:chemotaxis protein methyltransferase CheR
MKVTSNDLVAVSRFVRKLCGLVLDDSKGYLIESRLRSIAEDAGCSSYEELCHKAQANLALQSQVIDAITTQETLFFREQASFNALAHKAIPEAIDARADTPFPKRLRVWSAACSTGQEPYSIAMVLRGLLPDVDSWDVNILATDISVSALAKASKGRYTTQEIERGLDPKMLARHFQKESGGWRVKEELRYMIRFDRRNLLQSFTDLGPFDIIFCRNVAIYFDTDVRRDLFNRLADRLVPNGYLFVGSAESLDQLDPRFVPQLHCRSIYYQPNRRSSSAPTL